MPEGIEKQIPAGLGQSLIRCKVWIGIKSSDSVRLGDFFDGGLRDHGLSQHLSLMGHPRTDRNGKAAFA